MANNSTEPSSDEFLEQILGFSTFPPSDAVLPGTAVPPHMLLQLGSADGSGFLSGGGLLPSAATSVSGGFHRPVFPLGLSLEQGRTAGFMKPEEMVDNRVSRVKL